ncbi:MAG: GNAT family N-acetyltransferase [bacterium]|nr:GNAT family N-acetyltransferase [bacterium]
MHLISDLTILENFLRRDPALHAYGLGDLDEFFRPHTRWYADHPDGPQALVLRYQPGNASPVYHALGDADRTEDFVRLLLEIRPEFPDDFEVHISPAILSRAVQLNLFRDFRMARRELHHKMEWRPAGPDGLAGKANQNDAIQIVRADTAGRSTLEQFYAQAYPENWFDPRMLATGAYLIACMHNSASNQSEIAPGDIVGAAGVHVYSEEYSVAALGNIATHPEYRRQGVGRSLTAALCELLRDQGIATVTLNVKSLNAAAIACYQSLGFRMHAKYEELSITRQIS